MNLEIILTQERRELESDAELDLAKEKLLAVVIRVKNQDLVLL